MNERPFYIVDVFAQEKYAGTHVAVVRRARQFSDGEMQRIAREIGPAAFILSDEEEAGGYPVRIFTPTTELPFSGHPTLGAAYVITREILRRPVTTIVIGLPAGSVAVSVRHQDGDDVQDLMMRQKPAVFGQTFEPWRVASLLSLAAGDFDDRFPIEEASTGLPYLIVPVRTLEALTRARPIEDECARLLAETEAKAFALFCPETYSPERQLHVRVFARYHGVPEDPGTGTANGAIAGYLVKHRYWGQDAIEITVEQGHGLHRPSLLRIRARNQGGKIEVEVGGQVLIVARGILL